jgi:hypothetical protein
MTGAASPVDEERTRSDLVASLRQRLGPGTYDSLWQAGAATLTPDVTPVGTP